MANMEIRINSFLAENNLDESVKDSLIELVNGCFSDYVAHMSREWLTAVPSTKTTTVKATKAEKLDDPALAESVEDLRNCTSVVLNDYCRDKKLRVGGNKKDIMERVWRHLQGESTDDDSSPRSKPKKTPAKVEKHACFACNSKGVPCGSAATEQFNDKWFCWLHIKSAEAIIEKQVEVPVEEPEEPVVEEPKPVVATKPKGKVVKRSPPPKKAKASSELEESE